MLSELLQKLETEHGIPAAQGSGIINTIIEHVKEKFPQVARMIDSVLGSQMSGTSSTGASVNDGSGNSLQQLEDLAKSKLGGLFGN